MTGIIDIHAHILPGIDDGARNWEESRRMLETAYRQGIRHIIATPHYSRKGLLDGIRELAGQLQKEAGKIAPDFFTYLGQETYYHDELVQHLKEGQGLTLAGSRYVLVEFDPQAPYLQLLQGVRQLTLARYIPVLAHVERYQCLRSDGRSDGRSDSRMEELAKYGCRMQMNFSSLESKGLLDREVKWCRKQVLDRKIHYLGTDMHQMEYRKPDIQAAVSWMKTHISKREAAALLWKNSEIILQKKK
ncbi:MAG: CpsB/CapC family capsule biosynthesis tyrosine phosphatase [Lachnospiraceae bacterium]